MKLTIAFSLVRCFCGAERQAGRRCPECGREPAEVDADLERRRAIVQKIGDREPVEDVEPLGLDDAIPAIRAWFDGFSAAFDAVGEGSVEDAAGRLRESLEQLDALHARAACSPRLRPGHALWAAIDSVLVAYDGVRDAYLDTLTAATIDDVEAAAARGQAAIDSATAALERFGTLAEAWERVEAADAGDEHGDLLAGAEAVAALSGAGDMLALERKGAELFARITDGAVAAPSGFGLALQLLDIAVEMSMDPARFWQMARSVYQALVSYDVALRGLFADADWRADLTAVSLETRDASFEAAAVAAAGANRRRLVLSALRLAARQIERAAQPLVATLLAIDGRRAYASERNRDVNALLTRAAQSRHEDLLLGLDPRLRDADAHGQFEIEADGVRLTGSRGKLDYLRDEELVDVTLAGTESIAALYWGLVAALVAAGVDIEELEGALATDVADADKIKLVLLLNGWYDVEVHVDGAKVSARGERNSESSRSLIAAVVSVAPEGTETLTLEATDDGGMHTAAGPLAPLRRWSKASDELKKEIAFSLAAMAWTINGAPIMTRAHTEKVYAYRAVEALNPAVPASAALTTLRALLDASRAVGADQLALAIAAALRLRREVATGMGPTTSVDDVVSAFDRWLLVDLPELRSSW